MSDLYKLGNSDFLKGLLVAVLSAVFSVLYEIIFQGGFSAVEPIQILQIAVLAALSYLTKNFFTDKEDKLLGKVQL